MIAANENLNALGYWLVDHLGILCLEWAVLALVVWGALTVLRIRVPALRHMITFAALTAIAVLGLPTASAQNDALSGEQRETTAGSPFVDANLESAIRTALNKPTGRLLPTDLQRIWMLHIPNQNIKDLDGIEHLTSATALDFRNNEISDLSPLANLPLLERLYLSHNQLEDIAPLAEVRGLSKLYLDHNDIDDISPLRDLWLLRILRLDHNHIDDIKPLDRPNSGLVWLSMHHNDLRDISPLQTLTRLKALDLSHNQIRDLSSLVQNSGLAAGDTLNISNNPLSPTALATDLPALIKRGVSEGEVQPILTGSGEFTNGISYFTLPAEDFIDLPHGPMHYFQDEGLKNIVANPAGTNAQRFVALSLKLGIATTDPQAPALTPQETTRVDSLLAARSFLMRSAITKVLRAKTIEQLEGHWIEILERDLRVRINNVVRSALSQSHSSPGALTVRKVVITDLVIQ